MSYSINDFIYIQADTGDVSFTGNFVVPGTITSSNMNILNITSNNAQVIITNSGTGPALKVTQTGSEPIAEFYDGGAIALKVVDGGLVGIGTTVPRKLLDIQGGDVIVSGSIGVGTTNPTTKLHIVGNLLTTGTITTSNISVIGDFVTMNTITSNTEQMVIENAGTGPALKVTQTGVNSIAEFYDDGGAIALKVADGGNIGIGTMTPRKLLDVQGGDIIVSGNIGIGTTIPIHSLHVDRQAYFNGNLGIGTIVPRQLFDLQGGDAIVSGNIGIGTTIPIHSLHVGRQAYFNGNLGIGTTIPRQLFDLQGGNAIVSGNVGIGTTNPLSKLHVYQYPVLVGNSSDTDSGRMISALDSTVTTGGIKYITLGQTNSLNNQAELSYYHAGDGSGANYAGIGLYGGPSLYVTGNGNIGIGISTPLAKLHITAGTATVAPILLTTGTILTSAVAGSIEYDGTNMYVSPNANYGRSIIPATLYTSGVGTSGITLNTDYAIFPTANDTITLPIGTYLVKLAIQVTVATSVVSSALTINIRGGGNAVGSFSWRGVGAITVNGATNSFPVAATALGTAFAVTAASAVAGRVYICIGEGILKITTGGTITPSYRWTATLTSGVVTLFADNYMIIQALDTQSAAAFGPAGCGFG